MLARFKNTAQNVMPTKRIQTVDALIDSGFAVPEDRPALSHVAKHFAIGISEHVAQHINPNDPDDPLRKQYVPDPQERTIQPEEQDDPIGDQPHTKVPGIIHRYPDRCLLTPIRVCAVYCRFCFRKEHIGPGSATLTPEELDQAMHYVATHPEIWEVILTGGDPLMLKPASLHNIMQRLDAINSVEIIRFHTRIPVVSPEKVTPALIQAIKSTSKTPYVLLHINHAKELTTEAKQAIAQIIDAGIPMLSQTVLLRGINNDIDTLSELMKQLVKNRIKPYYLHHPDLAKGTQHFRVTIEEGQQLLARLRGRFSGLCQPDYVLDIPGGFGKVPSQQSYLQDRGEGRYDVFDHHGKQHFYTSS